MLYIAVYFTVNAAKNIKQIALKELDKTKNSPVGSGDEPVESPSLDGAVKQELIQAQTCK